MGKVHSILQTPKLAARVTAMLFPSLSLNRHPTNPNAAVIAIGAVIAVAAAPTIAVAAPHEATTLVCTNPASHASWQIHIDFERGTVDSNPARISEAAISWHDRTDGGNYTLDRKSGELTVVVASSTGGYFLHDRCTPDRVKPRS